MIPVDFASRHVLLSDWSGQWSYGIAWPLVWYCWAPCTPARCSGADSSSPRPPRGEGAPPRVPWSSRRFRSACLFPPRASDALRRIRRTGKKRRWLEVKNVSLWFLYGVPKVSKPPEDVICIQQACWVLYSLYFLYRWYCYQCPMDKNTMYCIFYLFFSLFFAFIKWNRIGK